MNRMQNGRDGTLLLLPRDRRRGPGGAIHDPLAVAAVLHPEFVETVELNLTAETDGESRGRTIGDLKRIKQREKR